MYSFKNQDAEAAIRVYQRKHPNSKAAVKALNGDCAAMMELYEKLCGPIEQVIEEGPSDDAAMILSEAAGCKYTPAMVILAQVEMCADIQFWPEGVMLLIEAYQLGNQDAMTQLQNDWHNCVKEVEARYSGGAILSKYEEFVLAFYYYHGIGTQKNEALAIQLFQSSAKRGCKEAKITLQDIRSGAIDVVEESLRTERTMVRVRIGCIYPDDMDFNDYEEGERIQIDSNALSGNFMILADEDQDEALDGREGELLLGFEYELHDGQLCAIIDDEFVPCEDEDEFEDYLRRRYEE